MKLYQRESAIVRYKGNIISTSIGTAYSVEFDFETVWGFIHKEPDFNINNLDFIHVHPPEFLNFSYQDYLCSKSLKIAFGEDVIMGLVVFMKPHIHIQFQQADYNIFTYRYPITLSQLKLLYELSI